MRVFFKFDMDGERGEHKLLNGLWDSISRPKTPWSCRRRHFISIFIQVISPFDHLQNVNQLPAQTKPYNIDVFCTWIGIMRWFI